MGVFKMVLISALAASVLLGCGKDVEAQKQPKFTYEEAMTLYSEIERSASLPHDFFEIQANDDQLNEIQAVQAYKDKFNERMLFMRDLVKRTNTFFDGEADYAVCIYAAEEAQHFWGEISDFAERLSFREKYCSELSSHITRLLSISFVLGERVMQCQSAIDALNPQNQQK